MPDTYVQNAPRVSDNERYLVHSRLEIIGILRGLIAHSSFVTASFGGHDDFIVTAILALNPEFEELILDYGADELANKRMLAAPRITFMTQLDHIRIQFTVTKIETTMFEGARAFRTRLPSKLTRLQRREFYRVKVPLGQTTFCALKLPAAGVATVQARIADVSCGGIAIVDYPDDLALEPGTVFKDCEIDLKDLGQVVTDLEIVHVLEKTTRNAARSRLAGCRFRNLSNGMLTLIQRYINKIEREVKALT